MTTRDVYVPELAEGNVDIVPDYLAGLTDFLNTEANGPDADLVSSNDPDETLAALEPLAEAKGIAILPPSEATDQNAFFVTTAFAEEHDLETLSDFAAQGQPIKLGGPEDCAGRADCQGGLESVYGFEITELVPLGFGSPQVKDAVLNGEVQLGETGTTDGTLGELGLTLLEDDKGIQPAQNLTPAVNADFLADNPDLEDALQRALGRADHRGPRGDERPGRPRAQEARGRRPAVPRGQGPALTSTADTSAGTPAPDSGSRPMIRLRGVGKTYPDGTVAVQGLDLDVARGELAVPGRAVRVRQVDDAEDDQPAHRADLRLHRDRRPGRDRVGPGASCAAGSATSSSRSACSPTRASAPT